MTAKLNRRAAGYPYYVLQTGIATLAPANTIVGSSSYGPGEILGFSILKYAGTNPDFALIGFKVIIDGVTYYDSYLGYLASQWIDNTFHNLHATSDVQTTTLVSFSFGFRMSYESSWSLTWKNQGGANISLGIGIHYRRGA